MSRLVGLRDPQNTDLVSSANKSILWCSFRNFTMKFRCYRVRSVGELVLYPVCFVITIRNDKKLINEIYTCIVLHCTKVHGIRTIKDPIFCVTSKNRKQIQIVCTMKTKKKMFLHIIFNWRIWVLSLFCSLTLVHQSPVCEWNATSWRKWELASNKCEDLRVLLDLLLHFVN